VDKMHHHLLHHLLATVAAQPHPQLMVAAQRRLPRVQFQVLHLVNQQDLVQWAARLLR